jgi:hypothetical protein
MSGRKLFNHRGHRGAQGTWFVSVIPCAPCGYFLLLFLMNRGKQKAVLADSLQIFLTGIETYGETPAGGCGAAVVVAAAASFRIR